MSKGGTTTTGVEIPDYLRQPIVNNLNRAEQVAQMGYTPYYGPDVAAQTPMQQAAIGNISQAANAFGLGGGNINSSTGMPDAQTYAGGVQGYSSAPVYQQSLDTLQANRPDQYNAIEGMFNPSGNYDNTYTSGYGQGGQGGGGQGGGGILGTGVTGEGLLNAGMTGLVVNSLTDGALVDGLGKAGSYVGNALGIGGGAAQAAPAIASALAPASGAVSSLAGTGAASFFGGGAPAASGLSIAGGGAPLTSAFTAGGFPAATGPVGGVAGGGGGIGGLFGGQAFGGGGAGTLGAIAAPAALFAASIPASKFIARDVLGFGSETDARRDQLADWSENSGFDDYKSMVSSESGMDYGDYIESKRPPTNPFQAELNAIGNSGDRQYEEEQVMNMFQSPYGKKLMSDFYAQNPDWYTPEGKRVFTAQEAFAPDGSSMGFNEAGVARDRAAQAWYDGGQVGPNPASEYVSNVLNRDDYGMINGLGFKQTRN